MSPGGATRIASLAAHTLIVFIVVMSMPSQVSVPANHSAAALLRLAESRYNGCSSLFIRVLVDKKYALPRRVIEALVTHFASFVTETKRLPVRTTYQIDTRCLACFITSH